MLSGCLYFDYGVEKSKAKLPYRTYYFSEKDKDYDFTTVLFSVKKMPSGTFNYTDFNISISHLYKEIDRNDNKGKYIYEIHFSNFTAEDKIQILQDSIILVHKDKDGNILKHEKIVHNLGKISKGKYKQ